jgi:hypothetical protein
MDVVSILLLAEFMYVVSDKLTLRGPSSDLVTSRGARVSIVAVV